MRMLDAAQHYGLCRLHILRTQPLAIVPACTLDPRP